MRYLWTCIKLQFRIPVSIFFSLLFPIIMMFTMITSYGNFDIGNGFHFVDKYFLISTGIGMMTISLISFPMWLGESIQNQSYKRLEYFGLRTQNMILAEVFAYLLLTLMTIITNILFGFFIYGLRIPNIVYLSSYIIQCLYCNFVLLIFGSIIALLVKNTNILMPMGMIFLFSFYIFTGVFTSFSDLPETFQTIGKFIPMKYVMNDFFDVWSKKILFIQDFLILNTILAIILVFFLIIFVILTPQSKKN